jgi:hypothetical protein
MKKQQLLDKLDQIWAALKASYSGMSEEQLTTPGINGDWSVKDTLAHVTTWEQEALKYLPLILEGKRPPRYSVMYGGVDAFNALMTEQKRQLSLAEVLTQLDNTHQEMMEYIRDAPEDQFTTETRFRRRIRLDTYGHYSHHTQAILEWREHLA